ncbi:hypothetical protein FE782_09300 [Paenibacillus antri]|uniref:Uncharacterized protein n=1 Tax=Paenibacillus antri TaxID=2582848 RepID=A0A5R9G8R9_9BACL|nr:hypothetical protein FE782_09300 [Paenibacillus antri]
MLRLLDKFFHEHCPQCGSTLIVCKTPFFSSHIIKTCPNGDYTKEFHPALETYIETRNVG